MKGRPLQFALVVWLSFAALGSPPGAAATARRLLDERDFRLAKHGREQTILTVEASGTIVVKVQVKRPLPTLPIHLLLEGPGGLQIEKKDTAPLRLRYPIDASQTGDTWRASVINLSNLGPVTGKLTVELETAAANDEAGTIGRVGGTKARRPDGRVTVVDQQKIRAACRDKNTDIFVRLDMESRTGTLFMSYNPVFTVGARYRSESLIEIRGSGKQPLYLDLEQRRLYFASGEEGNFCRLRIFYGESR